MFIASSNSHATWSAKVCETTALYVYVCTYTYNHDGIDHFYSLHEV